MISGRLTYFKADTDMKKNTKTGRYQFLQKEEAWIIQALVEIEKTKNPTEEEMLVIDRMNKSLFIEEADPFIDTFETFAKITANYDIADMPSGMTGFTKEARFSHYTGPGDGGYFNLLKEGEDGKEKMKKNRQIKRISAFEKAAAGYDDPADILSNVALIRENQELKARILALETQTVVIDQSVIQPTEHSFADITDFLDRTTTVTRKQPSAKLQLLRKTLRERKAMSDSMMH
jgi:hypothetical protein